MSDNPPSRILIVDDEEAHLKALCDTLQGQGYETAGFSRPVLALDEIQPGRFDVLLTDLMMPEMDGIALLEAARRIDPNLAGIIMTGEGTITTAVEAMKSGAMDYVLKPFKLRALLPILERALSVRWLRLQNAALEQRIRERTAELEMANKELEAFSYSVSHDLRAPLRHIDGYASILMEQYIKDMPPDARRLLEVVIGETRQMGKLIDDLLRFSRLSRQPLAKESINSAALFREVLEPLQKEHAARKVEVRFGELPDCHGDGSLLRQVVVNLLSNAFKFTRQRENAIVEIGGRMQDQERVYFVRDNGAGFDMQYARRLFGVFQRMHTSEEFEGTGVGLSIVQRIVIRHGGRVWAEAAVDQGATFYFTLPA
jgi:two-component system, sensor histidine kinase and response regulator